MKRYCPHIFFISVLLLGQLYTGAQMVYATTTGGDVFVRLDSMAENNGKSEVVIHDVPYANNELEYSIILPGNWSVQKISSPEGRLSVGKMLPIGIYLGERDGVGNPRIQIQAIRVPQTTDVQQWIADYFSTITNAKILSFNYRSRDIVDVNVEWTIKGHSFLSRMLVKRHDDKLFTVECMADKNTFDRYQEIFLKALASFKTGAVKNL